MYRGEERTLEDYFQEFEDMEKVIHDQQDLTDLDKDEICEKIEHIKTNLKTLTKEIPIKNIDNILFKELTQYIDNRNKGKFHVFSYFKY